MVDGQVNGSKVPEKAARAEPLVDPAPRPYRVTFANLWLWAAIVSAVPLAFYGHVAQAASAVGVATLAAIVIYSRRKIPATLRRSVRRLPVLRDPGMQRVGALLGFAGKTCGRCEHFDLVAGQEMLKHNTFGMATAVLNPSQMAKTAKGAWKEETGFDERGQPLEDPTSKDRWHELGACNLKRIGVFAPQSCKDWS